MDQVVYILVTDANTFILHQVQLQGGGRGMEKNGDHNPNNYVAAN